MLAIPAVHRSLQISSSPFLHFLWGLHVQNAQQTNIADANPGDVKEVRRIVEPIEQVGPLAYSLAL